MTSPQQFDCHDSPAATSPFCCSISSVASIQNIEIDLHCISCHHDDYAMGFDSHRFNVLSSSSQILLLQLKKSGIDSLLLINPINKGLHQSTNAVTNAISIVGDVDLVELRAILCLGGDPAAVNFNDCHTSLSISSTPMQSTAIYQWPQPRWLILYSKSRQINMPQQFDCCILLAMIKKKFGGINSHQAKFTLPLSSFPVTITINLSQRSTFSSQKESIGQFGTNYQSLSRSLDKEYLYYVCGDGSHPRCFGSLVPLEACFAISIVVSTADVIFNDDEEVFSTSGLSCLGLAKPYFPLSLAGPMGMPLEHAFTSCASPTHYLTHELMTSPSDLQIDGRQSMFTPTDSDRERFRSSLRDRTCASRTAAAEPLVVLPPHRSMLPTNEPLTPRICLATTTLLDKCCLAKSVLWAAGLSSEVGWLSTVKRLSLSHQFVSDDPPLSFAMSRQRIYIELLSINKIGSIYFCMNTKMTESTDRLTVFHGYPLHDPIRRHIFQWARTITFGLDLFTTSNPTLSSARVKFSEIIPCEPQSTAINKIALASKTFIMTWIFALRLELAITNLMQQFTTLSLTHGILVDNKYCTPLQASQIVRQIILFYRCLSGWVSLSGVVEDYVVGGLQYSTWACLCFIQGSDQAAADKCPVVMNGILKATMRPVSPLSLGRTLLTPFINPTIPPSNSLPESFNVPPRQPGFCFNRSSLHRVRHLFRGRLHPCLGQFSLAPVQRKRIGVPMPQRKRIGLSWLQREIIDSATMFQREHVGCGNNLASDGSTADRTQCGPWLKKFYTTTILRKMFLPPPTIPPPLPNGLSTKFPSPSEHSWIPPSSNPFGKPYNTPPGVSNYISTSTCISSATACYISPCCCNSISTFPSIGPYTINSTISPTRNPSYYPSITPTNNTSCMVYLLHEIPCNSPTTTPSPTNPSGLPTFNSTSFGFNGICFGVNSSVCFRRRVLISHQPIVLPISRRVIPRYHLLCQPLQALLPAFSPSHRKSTSTFSPTDLPTICPTIFPSSCPSMNPTNSPPTSFGSADSNFALDFMVHIRVDSLVLHHSFRGSWQPVEYCFSRSSCGGCSFQCFLDYSSDNHCFRGSKVSASIMDSLCFCEPPKMFDYILKAREGV